MTGEPSCNCGLTVPRDICGPCPVHGRSVYEPVGMSQTVSSSPLASVDVGEWVRRLAAMVPTGELAAALKKATDEAKARSDDYNEKCRVPDEFWYMKVTI